MGGQLLYPNLAGDSSSPGRRKFRKTTTLIIQISEGVPTWLKILPMFCFLVAKCGRGGGGGVVVASPCSRGDVSHERTAAA